MPEVLVRFRKPLLPLISGAGWVTAGMLDRAREASDRSGLAAHPAVRLRIRKGQPGAGVLCGADELVHPDRVCGAVPAALYTHDRVLALGAFKEIQVLVICGDEDLLTPVEHSEAFVDACPMRRWS